MSDRPHLFQCLTREEFQVCWALRMTLGFEDYDDAYPLSDYRSPRTGEKAEFYEEEMLRAIRFLALGHNLQFEGLEVHEDGRIRMVPVEPRNAVYVRGIALYVTTDGELGAMPHPIRAIDTAREYLARKVPDLSLTPLTDLRLELEKALDEARKIVPPPDPEEVAEREDLTNRALSALGVERTGSGGIH